MKLLPQIAQSNLKPPYKIGNDLDTILEIALEIQYCAKLTEEIVKTINNINKLSQKL